MNPFHIQYVILFTSIAEMGHVFRTAYSVLRQRDACLTQGAVGVVQPVQSTQYGVLATSGYSSRRSSSAAVRSCSWRAAETDLVWRYSSSARRGVRPPWSSPATSA